MALKVLIIGAHMLPVIESGTIFPSIVIDNRSQVQTQDDADDSREMRERERESVRERERERESLPDNEINMHPSILQC